MGFCVPRSGRVQDVKQIELSLVETLGKFQPHVCHKKQARRLSEGEESKRRAMKVQSDMTYEEVAASFHGVPIMSTFEPYLPSRVSHGRFCCVEG